ncbi:hypothetical protein FRC12_023654 [Ceratobasidium sp. 428]|nr:hypothetical protein FRC12_023654 [Ceratobasidium sp. 428]
MMPWETNRAMMQDVDKLPHGPSWTVQAYEIPGDLGTETAESWCQNAFKAVKTLLGDKLLGKHIQFKAYRKYTSEDGTERIRDEIFTADWMWRTQDAIPDPHATVISVIISSDETKLTTFSGDKKAHPVYLTIGNIPKRLRRRISKRANILIGYLPVPKLDCISDKEQRKATRRKLFHTCMKNILQPLQDAIDAGGIEVRCADGGVRRIYPCLAAYIADFPEQCKVACTRTTHCPLCTVHPDERGNYKDAPPRQATVILEAQEKHKTTGSAMFERLGLFQVKPFWDEFPYVDVGCFLTPDLLHQLHKGVLKDHLTKWATHILGKAVIDERHKSMPEYHGMRHFKNGISAVSQWTGRELKEMAKVLLPVISDAADRSVVVAARALLDFVYLAHSSSLTDSELDAMDTALRTFHEHKEIFCVRGAVKTKKAFHGIPKIHMIRHYVRLIRELGTADGYNTETSKRLHIDFAKMGYRASNKVNATKQMALYIQRTEALAMHAAYLESEGKVIPDAPKLRVNGRDEEDLEDEEGGWDEWDEEEEEYQDAIDDAALRVGVAVTFDEWLINGRPVPGSGRGGTWEVEEPHEGVNAAADPPLYHPVPEYVITKTPTVSNVSLDYLAEEHGATKLLTSLRTFVKRVRPGTRRHDIPSDIKLNVWSRVRLVHSPAPFKPSEGPTLNVMRAWPEKVDVFERVSRPPRFDTVLVLTDPGNSGIHRYRVARVRAIFEIPDRYDLYKGELVYVEMFNEIPPRPEAPIGLFTSTRSIQSGSRITAVFPLSKIRLTCHLAPRYRTFNIQPDEILYHSDVLQLCETFFINVFASYFWYELIRHWGQQGGDTPWTTAGMKLPKTLACPGLSILFALFVLNSISCCAALPHVFFIFTPTLAPPLSFVLLAAHASFTPSPSERVLDVSAMVLVSDHYGTSNELERTVSSPAFVDHRRLAVQQGANLLDVNSSGAALGLTPGPNERCVEHAADPECARFAAWVPCGACTLVWGSSGLYLYLCNEANHSTDISALLLLPSLSLLPYLMAQSLCGSAICI